MNKSKQKDSSLRSSSPDSVSFIPSQQSSASNCIKSNDDRSYDSDTDLQDLELGRSVSVESLRDQAGKLSSLIQSKTELHGLNMSTPMLGSKETPYHNQLEIAHSGFQYWRNEIISAQEHGGDFWKRADTAFRAAIGSLTTFSILIFPHQQLLGAGEKFWI